MTYDDFRHHPIVSDQRISGYYAENVLYFAYPSFVGGWIHTGAHRGPVFRVSLGGAALPPRRGLLEDSDGLRVVT